MVAWREIYAEAYSSGAINASASELYGNDKTKQSSQEHRDRYGSANSLILTSLADEDFEILLDGVNTVGILYTRGSFIIRPEDGIFFSYVKLTNLSATNSAANEIKVRIAKATRVTT